jgi:hypothetical protein
VRVCRCAAACAGHRRPAIWACSQLAPRASLTSSVLDLLLLPARVVWRAGLLTAARK